MNKYKILNLYSCLGGNRYKWDEVAQFAGIEIEVTAVEMDQELNRLYSERFPNDKIIQADAHQYLLDHFKEFDFIWSSPPCPSHSKARFWGSKGGQTAPIYPDIKLYEEIIFLKHFFTGKWVVENVNPYYEPLIKAEKRDRHLYWANFEIPKSISNRKDPGSQRGANELLNLCNFHEFDFKQYKGDQKKIKIARNLVDYEAGANILKAALNVKENTKSIQNTLF